MKSPKLGKLRRDDRITCLEQQCTVLLGETTENSSLGIPRVMD